MSRSKSSLWSKGCGAQRSASLFYLLLLLVPLFLPGTARAEGPDLPTLLARAKAEQLPLARPWQVLLHYRQRGDGYESLIDDRDFFIDLRGKTDPAAELAANLEVLFSTAELGDTHFRCRFPARSEWLIETLQLREEELPQPVCGKLTEFITTVDPRAAVLVFPSAHGNGPASMFGHTLLRIDSSYQNALLSHAVNYAAQTDEVNGLLYAFKGIFGLYPGYFSVLQYYKKINEYSEMEHRDLWEYRLNLTPAEVRRLTLHSWELQDIASDYFFFDENCSFMLFFLLEAGRPELRLAENYWERTSFWVIPVDTLAAIRNAGLITDAVYRPAQATRIRQRASLLNDPAKERALAVALHQRSAGSEATFADAPLEERRQVLDLATEHLQYLYSKRRITENEFKPRFLEILTARSRLGAGEVDAAKVEAPARPESGHESGRYTLKGGARDGAGFVELGWRPAYHDLLEADEGFTRGAQINFFDLAGRIDPEHGTVRLHSFTPVDIVSLAPRTLFFQPTSWKVSFGVERRLLRDGKDHLLFDLNTGGGLAWEVGKKGLVYLMAEADVNLTGAYRDSVVLGGGGSAGVLLQPTADWKVHLYGSGLSFLREEHQEYRVALDQSLRLNRDLGLVLRGSWEESFGLTRREASLALNRYF